MLTLNATPHCTESPKLFIGSTNLIEFYDYVIYETFKFHADIVGVRALHGSVFAGPDRTGPNWTGPWFGLVPLYKKYL